MRDKIIAAAAEKKQFDANFLTGLSFLFESGRLPEGFMSHKDDDFNAADAVLLFWPCMFPGRPVPGIHPICEKLGITGYKAEQIKARLEKADDKAIIYRGPHSPGTFEKRLGSDGKPSEGRPGKQAEVLPDKMAEGVMRGKELLCSDGLLKESMMQSKSHFESAGKNPKRVKDRCAVLIRALDAMASFFPPLDKKHRSVIATEREKFERMGDCLASGGDFGELLRGICDDALNNIQRKEKDKANCSKACS